MNEEQTHRIFFPVKNYNLNATLTSGQVFGWHQQLEGWEGVIDSKWIRLQLTADGLQVETVTPMHEVKWLAHYLQVELDLEAVLSTFPPDEPMQAAVKACYGLRILRQNPWECLASFILSSSKQIVQIQQIVKLLSHRFGQPVAVPRGHEARYSFPSADRIARCSEKELRACKMGFRAPYLKATAQQLTDGTVNLSQLDRMGLEAARSVLLDLPGVGHKIADCVLLFAFGFSNAFPIDVWIRQALEELYFDGRTVTQGQLQEYTVNHFGPYAGYAQQYLFHYRRTIKHL